MPVRPSPDERLAQVGGIVNAAAYFGERAAAGDPPWAEDVLDDAVAARRRAPRRLRRRIPAPR